MPSPSDRKLTKSKLSMFLRTQCDRELFLSLHTDKGLERSGLPTSLTARPGIGALKTAGIEYEQSRNDLLNQAFPNTLSGDKGGKTNLSLDVLLAQVAATPTVILQSRFEVELFRATALTNLALEEAKQSLIPPLTDMIPDVVVVRNALPNEEEVLPDGTRRRVEEDETRQALVIVDIKHAGEPNPSYSAEVALYAFMLANWLRWRGKEDQYFVTANVALWTRSRGDDSQLQKLLQDSPTSSSEERLQALMADCDLIQFSFYMQTIRRFFRDDVPRVVAQGNADWAELEWHVGAKCSACDWLGYTRWLNAGDKAKVAANPDHYCVPNAELTEHLSRIVGMSRGARKTLNASHVPTTSALAHTDGSETAYEGHSLLKKERRRFPARAAALHTGEVSRDETALLATLARNAHLQVCVSVNFDSSAGFLSGLALRGRVGFPLRDHGSPTRVQLPEQAFIVDAKTSESEWAALEGFLDHFAFYIQRAQDNFRQHGFTQKLTAQVAFWEKRQYEELCAALGRHLPRVLALTDRKAKSLAWLFPSDELLEREEGAVSPCVTFVDEIVRRVVFLPVPHALTLWEAAEHYYHRNPPRLPDAFYREVLSSGIPRERIYELWSGSATIMRAGRAMPRLTLVTEFAEALKGQCRCLDSVILRLLIDFKEQLKGRAAVLNTSIPQGTKDVAFDSKLWIWWDRLEKATNDIKARLRLATDPETLESSFEALRLTRLVAQSEDGTRVYEVRRDSTEAKIDEGEGYLAVGLESIAGFPLSSARQFVGANAPAYSGEPNDLQWPLYSVLRATLVTFDREQCRATVRFNDRGLALMEYLESCTELRFDTDIYLTEGKSSYDPSRITRDVLLEIGNPALATPDPNAARAMGDIKAKVGNAPLTPAARVLWDAATLTETCCRSAEDARAIAIDAYRLARLNHSQAKAVRHAVERQLSVLWGPPGTGKTQTLSALLHAMVRYVHRAQADDQGEGFNILITGPTYKAVEELVGRLLSVLNRDTTCECEIFGLYSPGRIPQISYTAEDHISAMAFNRDDVESWETCVNSLVDPSRITIVATACHQVHHLNRAASRWGVEAESATEGTGMEENTSEASGDTAGYLFPLFDFVVLDESSQVPVTLALKALASLKPKGQLVVAGDHLQMPPIQSLEPPVGAEYLVGSIQTYLLKRPFNTPIKPRELLDNYRSADHLVKFARTIGYPPQLRAEHANTRLHLLAPIENLAATIPQSLPWSPAWAEVLAPERAAVTLLHDDDLSSQNNRSEAEIVAALVYCLRHTASAHLEGRSVGHETNQLHSLPTTEVFWRESIGIVTPHRAQRSLIIRELARLFPDDALDEIEGAVDTVEKFQGGQRHTILVSYGVGDPDLISGEEEFLLGLERTNVAISRAMAKCVVIMPRSLAGHVPEGKKTIETAHALKGFVDEFCCCTKPATIHFGDVVRCGEVRWHE